MRGVGDHIGDHESPEGSGGWSVLLCRKAREWTDEKILLDGLHELDQELVNTNGFLPNTRDFVIYQPVMNNITKAKEKGISFLALFIGRY